MYNFKKIVIKIYDKNKKLKCICRDCQNEASFFHSGCCNAHFEGTVVNGFPSVVCEECGKYIGKLIFKKIKK